MGERMALTADTPAVERNRDVQAAMSGPRHGAPPLSPRRGAAQVPATRKHSGQLPGTLGRKLGSFPHLSDRVPRNVVSDGTYTRCVINEEYLPHFGLDPGRQAVSHLDRKVLAVDFPQRGLGQLLHLVPERHLGGRRGFAWSRQLPAGRRRTLVRVLR